MLSSLEQVPIFSVGQSVFHIFRAEPLLGGVLFKPCDMRPEMVQVFIFFRSGW